MQKDRFKITTFSAIIVRKGEKILLMKRPQKALSGGFWAFPGGAIDGKETITSATIRESYEELGITINQNDLKFLHILHVKVDSEQEYINFFFETEKWQGELKVMEPHKCDEIAMFDINDLPKNILPTHQHVVNMVKKGIYFSEFGW
jgi:mutator protein MutT